MSSPYLSLPSPTAITASQLASILALYPPTVQVVYKQNARLKDPQKLVKALEDDRWRYAELPRVLSARRGGEGVGKDGTAIGPWLEKAELERLVNWKITHGAHRPFLPSLIHQNSPEAIKSTTESIFLQHKHPRHNQGVGPATATLLLAICNPDEIPYFSDELHAWLVPPHQSGNAGKLKLKYDLKEYRRLFEAWLAFKQTRVSRGDSSNMKAVDVEKVAYVLGHWNDLAPADKKSVFPEVAESSGHSISDPKEEEEEEEEEKTHVINADKPNKQKTADENTCIAANGIKTRVREISKRRAPTTSENEKEPKRKKMDNKLNLEPKTKTTTAQRMKNKGNSNTTTTAVNTSTTSTSTSTRQSKRLRHT